MDHAKALADALRKMRNQYFSQMKFADVEPAAYFREFVRKLDQILAAYDAAQSAAAIPTLKADPINPHNHEDRQNLADAARAEAATRENDVVEYPNPFDWKRPENIDGHPDRYNPLRDAIENILLTRLHQKRLEGHMLEVSMQIMDVVRLSTHPQDEPVRVQQQGADTFLVERLREAAANPNDIGCYIGAGDLIAAADALSRAQQASLVEAPQPDSSKAASTPTPLAMVTDVMDFVDPGPMGEGIFKDKDNLVWYAEPLVRAALTAALAVKEK